MYKTEVVNTKKEIEKWEANAAYYLKQYVRSLDRNDWLKYLLAEKNIRILKERIS